MKSDSDAAYEARANIGVGASLGAVVGAVVGSLLSDDSLMVIGACLLGAALGAAVGSRFRSQMPQFLWIEYPPRIGRMIVLSSFPFLALFSASIYAIKREAAGELQLILLLATVAATVPLFLAVGRVIAGLDDILKTVQLEGIAIGYGIGTFIVLALGLISLALPIPSNWLITAVIMLGAWLVGRFVVARRYR